MVVGSSSVDAEVPWTSCNIGVLLPTLLSRRISWLVNLEGTSRPLEDPQLSVIARGCFLRTRPGTGGAGSWRKGRSERKAPLLLRSGNVGVASRPSWGP